MSLLFDSKEELYEYLSHSDLLGLDSEYSYRSRILVEKFSARGLDLNRWWVMTGHDWTCPCCKRNKEKLVRLNKHNYLTGHLHEHHDHMSDYVEQKFTEISESMETVVADRMAERFIKRTAFALTAYDRTVICSDCNSSDGDAKKELCLPKEFSFSPNEISSFIHVVPNKKHIINKEKAMLAWQQCEPMFKARQRLVSEIASLAATNTHWYQPSEQTSRYIESCAENQMKVRGINKMGVLPHEQVLYSTNKFSGNSDSWRRNREFKYLNPPTEGQVAHLAAVRGQNWNEASLNWFCEGCGRSKFQCVRKSNKGEWSFNYYVSKEMFHEGGQSTRHTICSDCGDTLKHLGKEAKDIADVDYIIGSSIITLEELRSIIQVYPHSKHMINNVIADNLLPTLVLRAKKI